MLKRNFGIFYSNDNINSKSNVDIIINVINNISANSSFNVGKQQAFWLIFYWQKTYKRSNKNMIRQINIPYKIFSNSANIGKSIISQEE